MPPEVGELVMQLINGLACGPKAGLVYTHTRADSKMREMTLKNAEFNERGREGEGRYGVVCITSSCTVKISFPETFRVLHMAGKRVTGRRFTVGLCAHVCARVIKSVVNRLCRI